MNILMRARAPYLLLFLPLCLLPACGSHGKAVTDGGNADAKDANAADADTPGGDAGKPDAGSSDTAGDVAGPDLAADMAIPDLAPDMTSPDVAVDMAIPDLAPDMTSPDLAADMAIPDLAPDMASPDLAADMAIADLAPDTAIPDLAPDVANQEVTIDTAIADVADAGAESLETGNDGATERSACSQAPVALGAADNFVVLAGSTVTSTGPTSVTGDLGVSPGSAVTGFPPGTVVGSKHAGDPTAAAAEAALTTAYNDAKGRTLCPIRVSGNLGGMTLAPGLYKATSSLAISSGDLTLDGKGDSAAVFIFQMASTLTTTAGRKVLLIGGAKSSNVFWQVGTSATIGSTSAFQGTVMADQAITMKTGATLNGRVLARIAAVTMDSNTIVKPAP